MLKKGVHIQIVNSILDYCSKEWGIDAKRALLKISGINIDELEGVQNYIDQEIFYKLLDTIKYDLNRENKIKNIGSFCAKSIVEDSSYLHPILSQGNPLKFLKESDSVFSIFFPGCNFKIIQIKTNSFLLHIPLNKKMCLSLFIQGFLEEIIINFSKNAKLFIKEKYKDIERNNASYLLRYVNVAKIYENTVIYSILLAILIIVGFILWFTKTPYVYFALIEILSFVGILYPVTIYIENKKNKYNRHLIQELNALEKVLLGDKELSALEILNLKASISKLNEFGNSILGETNLENIIEKVTYDAKILLGSENALVYFYDKEKYNFYTKNTETNEKKYFYDEGIIGLISKLKKPIILNDPVSNPLYKIDLREEDLKNNIIAAPILDSQDELIAIIELSNKIENTDYTDIDINVLISICNYASLALQKYIMMNNIISEEHERMMSLISKYFSTKSFSNLMFDYKIPAFEGKNHIINYSKKFQYTFNKNFKITTRKLAKKKMFDDLLLINKIKNENLSIHFDQVDKSVLYRILQILILNSIDSGIENNKKFDCEIFFSDEIKIPEKIRNQYKISIPINEWNTRKVFLGDHFSDHLIKSYPLLDKDIDVIENSLIYKPKLIYQDRCGGVKKEIEEKIFYPFFTTKKNHNGMGLNLLLKIMNEINGNIEFINLPGIGVNIFLYF